MSPEILARAIDTADKCIKIYDKSNWRNLSNRFAELTNDDNYFRQVYLKDMKAEAELNISLVSLFAGADEPITIQEDRLTLLCLSGHIARLESRTFDTSTVLASYGIAIAAWSITLDKPSPYFALLILITSLLSLVALTIKWQLNKRITLLKQVSAHLAHHLDSSPKS